MSGLLARALLAALAVAVLVALVPALDNARTEATALELATGRDPASVRRAETLLRGELDAPGTGAEVSLAQLLLFAGRDREAAAVLEPVVAREPEDAQAWGLLAVALGRLDSPRAAEAQARERALEGR